MAVNLKPRRMTNSVTYFPHTEIPSLLISVSRANFFTARGAFSPFFLPRPQGVRGSGKKNALQVVFIPDSTQTTG